MTYYDILGVTYTASDDEIKISYRNMLKAFHPDNYRGDKEFAERKTMEILEAYNILRNSDTRREYDATILKKNGFYSSFDTKQEHEEKSYSSSSSADVKGLPMNWFNFYTYVRLPIGIVFSIYTIMSSFSLIPIGTYVWDSLPSYGKLYLIFYYVLMLLIFCLHVYCVFNLRKFESTAFYLNMLFLVFEPILYIWSYTYDVMDSVILLLCIFLLFVVPNIIYFYKRRDKFGIDKSAPHFDNSFVQSLLLLSAFAMLIFFSARTFLFESWVGHPSYDYTINYTLQTSPDINNNNFDIYVYTTENGDKYHLYDCRYINATPTDEIYYIPSQQEAIDLGYEPCKMCLPQINYMKT